jgi:uncharacterized protein (DUF2147 family)
MDLRPLLLALTALAFTAGPLSAVDPGGVWLTDGGEARVRIADCGGALCGTVLSLRDPNDPATGRPHTDKNNADASKRGRPVVGIQVLFGMKPSGADKWTGQIYNAKDGKTYSGSMTVQGASALKLEGCVLGGLICRSETWTRTN